MYAKLNKCEFWMDRVSFFRHVGSKDDVSFNLEKLDVVVDRKRPTIVFEIIRFLGLASYYRRFIEGFPKISLPLTRLT